MFASHSNRMAKIGLEAAQNLFRMIVEGTHFDRVLRKVSNNARTRPNCNQLYQEYIIYVHNSTLDCTGRLPLIRIRYNSNIPCYWNFFDVPIFCKSLQVKIECIIRSTKSAPVG